MILNNIEVYFTEIYLTEMVYKSVKENNYYIYQARTQIEERRTCVYDDGHYVHDEEIGYINIIQ